MQGGREFQARLRAFHSRREYGTPQGSTAPNLGRRSLQLLACGLDGLLNHRNVIDLLGQLCKGINLPTVTMVKFSYHAMQSKVAFI